MVYCISGVLINESISDWRILLRNFRRLMIPLIIKSSMATESIISNFRDFLHFIQRSEQIKIGYFSMVCSESLLYRLLGWINSTFSVCLSAHSSSARERAIPDHGQCIGKIVAILSSTRIMRKAGRFRTISIDNASRLKSSTTLNV